MPSQYVPVSGSSTLSYLQASHNANFVFAAANAGEPLPFNTNDVLSGNITHPVGAGNTEITITQAGTIIILAQPQVRANAAGEFHMWLELDTGGGFADVANSNVDLALPNNGTDVIPLIAILDVSAGDSFRIMGSVTTTNVILETTSPAGEPTIPACILAVHTI